MKSTAGILSVIDYHQSTCERTYRQIYQSVKATQDQYNEINNLRNFGCMLHIQHSLFITESHWATNSVFQVDIHLLFIDKKWPG
jgi:hypothetical protein